MLGQVLPCGEVEGKSVTLVPPEIDHLGAYMAAFADPDVARYRTRQFAVTPAEQQEWLGQTSRDPNSVFWSILLGEEMIGYTAIIGIDWRVRTAHTGVAIFDREHRAKGIATLAMTRRCRFAFETLGLACLFTESIAANEASWRAARRVGYAEYGRKPFAAFIDGAHHESVLGYLTPELLVGTGDARLV